MLVPKPKKAVPVAGDPEFRPERFGADRGHFGSPPASAAMSLSDDVTQPKMPPWATIIFRADVWNSGEYEPQQSSMTRHS